tara:strand:+ start:2513 stop:2815 length:303 start_codon:yes stop_codon:yes gene_type:complete
MDWLELLERYGVPLVVAVAFWLFIQKQNKYIQEELSKSLKDYFARNESILIKLIDNAKKTELKIEGQGRYSRAIVEIMAKLSGNGLKHKFMNMLNKDDKE